jgi:hypothetical protein|tara:strand:- start:208 stop:324 length:117 start_codon:yes stop_codon:yes gene_type:complete
MKFMRKIKIWIRVLFWVVPKEIGRWLRNLYSEEEFRNL